MKSTAVSTSFEQQMKDMLKHYKSGSGVSYVKANGTSFVAISSETLPVDLQLIKDNFEASSFNVLEMSKKDGNDGIELLKNESGGNRTEEGGPISDFEQQMQARKQETLKYADDTITKAYDDLIRQGNEHPDQQPMILSLGDLLGQVFEAIGAKILDFFTQVIQQIVEFFKSVRDWIVKAANAVADWFTGAWNSISDFFGF